MSGRRTRREFLVQSASGAVALGFLGFVSPAGLAAAQGLPPRRLRVFSRLQAATYAAWCDVLAIGAAKAGVARFVDKYLARPYPDFLLLLRYLQNPPFDDFYLGGIAGVNEESRARFSKPFLALGADERNAVVEAAATSTTQVWTEPDLSFFYFVSRSDAVDVVYGTVKGPTRPHLGILGANLLSQEGYDNKTPAPGAFGSRSWLGGQAAKPNDLLGVALARPELYGQALDGYLRAATKHFGNMTALCEETSIYENQIELDSSEKDAYGLPAAKVVNNIPKENAARLDLAKTEGLEIFRAAGTSEVWASNRNAEHLVGGTLMGSDPDSSITNSYGQTHEVDNLFVAGASLFRQWRR